MSTALVSCNPARYAPCSQAEQDTRINSALHMLRSKGFFVQATGVLHRKHGRVHEYCIMGVFTELARLAGVPLLTDVSSRDSMGGYNYHYNYMESAPPLEVVHYYGLVDGTGRMSIPSERRLMFMNDQQSYSLPELANFIEENRRYLFVPYGEEREYPVVPDKAAAGKAGCGCPMCQGKYEPQNENVYKKYMQADYSSMENALTVGVYIHKAIAGTIGLGVAYGSGLEGPSFFEEVFEAYTKAMEAAQTLHYPNAGLQKLVAVNAKKVAKVPVHFNCKISVNGADPMELGSWLKPWAGLGVVPPDAVPEEQEAALVAG